MATCKNRCQWNKSYGVGGNKTILKLCLNIILLGKFNILEKNKIHLFYYIIAHIRIFLKKE